MWNIPPIVGQKVMLDPSYGHYADFNRTQSRGKDGYILSIEGMTLSRWFLGTRYPTAVVVWESGYTNSYEMKALLPIDSFKTVERVEFMSGHFEQVYNESGRNYVAERVIMKNDDVRHYSMFDKEKRLGILRKAEATFQTLDEEHQNQESVQMKYMSILEEIERTKRAEETVLFFESEGDDVPTPKKHQEVAHPSFSDYADIERSVRNNPTVSDLLNRRLITDLMASEVLIEGTTPRRRDTIIVDEDFLNPCAEVEVLRQNTGYGVDLTRNLGQGATPMSPYLEQMERLGAESRARSEADKQVLIRKYREAFGLPTTDND